MKPLTVGEWQRFISFSDDKEPDQNGMFFSVLLSLNRHSRFADTKQIVDRLESPRIQTQINPQLRGNILHFLAKLNDSVVSTVRPEDEEMRRIGQSCDDERWIIFFVQTEDGWKLRDEVREADDIESEKLIEMVVPICKEIRAELAEQRRRLEPAV